MLLEEVARVPPYSSPPHPQLFSTRRVLPRLRATLSLTLLLTRSIIHLTLMLTSPQLTIFTHHLLILYHTHCSCHPWVDLLQWLALREHWELV